ncbi:LysR family transcriptional regulator [Nitrosomonadaceae bacterium]|nr:LysR family transcriptional regulator [Nitrosomonadaceae bacterium]
MQRLNYQHLYYFWQVARVGSITKASEKLGLAQPTISGQIAIFENSIGTQLFKKSGRNIILTDKGKLVFNYAEDIFSLGQQLTHALTGQKTERTKRITIGVLKSIDELIISKIIAPMCNEKTNIKLITIDEKKELISSNMLINGFDFILSDIQPNISDRNKIYSTTLGISGLSIYATEELTRKYSEHTPWSLRTAPFILPSFNTHTRRLINNWLEEKSLAPTLVAEIDDSSLTKSLASVGLGMIFSPTSIKKEISKHYKLTSLYDTSELINTYYLFHPQKKVESPVIQELINKSNAFLNNF